MKKYTQEEIMNYIESQIKEAGADLKECYIAELGIVKGKKAFESFTRIAELCVIDDGYSGMFVIQNNKRNFGSWFFEDELQGKYIGNVKRRFNLTDNLVEQKDKKQTLKSVIKEMKQNEKLAKKANKTNEEDKAL